MVFILIITSEIIKNYGSIFLILKATKNLSEKIKDLAIVVLLNFNKLKSLALFFFQPFYYRTKVTTKKVIVSSTIIGWGVSLLYVGILAGINILWYYREENENMKANEQAMCVNADLNIVVLHQ